MKPVTTYWPDGQVRAITYKNSQKKVHRVGDPAQICHSKDGRIRAEIWMHEGAIHREDGAAMLEFERVSASKEFLRLEKWYVHNKLHRLGGPAIVQYDNGTPSLTKWFKEGVLHRADGPAVTFVDKDSTSEHWALEGRMLPPFSLLLSGTDDDERRRNVLEFLETLKAKNDVLRARHDWTLIRKYLVADFDFVQAFSNYLNF